MRQESQSKFSATSSGRESTSGQFSPLGYTPLSTVKIRQDEQFRVQEGFLVELVEAFAAGSSSLSVGGVAPVLIAVDGSEVLLDPVSQLPLTLDPDLVNCSALKEAVALPQIKASVIFAGQLDLDLESVAGTATVPVLALCGDWQRFIDCPAQNLNLLGPEGEQSSLKEVLAAYLGGRWVSARILAQSIMEDADLAKGVGRQWLELVSAASALSHWHARSVFDPATGQRTVVGRAGWSRLTAEGRELFPRTDPAVITAVTALVEGEEKILLGQARAWEKNRFSTFAGFVEAGESAENAVERELWEECGAQVASMVYMGSQPWPFPRSLMLGFRAEIANPESVRADGEEIEKIRWFSRSELKETFASQEIKLPARSSISRLLIENFLGQGL